MQLMIKTALIFQTKKMKIQRLINTPLIVFIALMTLIGNVFADTNSARFEGWQILGPNGGDIRVIAIDPKNKNQLYVTTMDSQVYKSPDAGMTWKFLGAFSIPELTLDDLIIDVEDSNNIFVSGHRHIQTGGFMYSRDGGTTWTESKELKKVAIHALAQSPSNPNILVAGGNGAVYISYNKGEEWSKITNDKVPFASVIVDSAAFDPKNADTIYIGTTWRPYKSTDGGKTWSLISKGMIDDSDVFAIDIDPKNPDHIVSSACSGIYESLNGGDLWTKIQGIPSQSRRTKAIVRNPAGNGGIYAGTTEGFWMSANDGKSWAITSQRQLEVNSIAVHPSEPNKIYIATNNYGIMVSRDGGRNFTVQNGNFSSRFVLQIVPDIQRPNRLYATTNNTTTGGGFVFVSDDGGQSWQASNKNLTVIRTTPFALLQDKQNPNLIYIGTYSGIYRSLDRGASWTPAPTVKLPKPKMVRKTVVVKGKRKVVSVPAAPVTPNLVATLKTKVNLLVHTNDGKNGIIAATDSGIYRTYNIATGWEKMPLGEGVNEQIFALHVSPVQPNTIWVGTVRSGVLVSKDNGETWSKVEGVPSTMSIQSIEIDAQNPNRVYVGTAQTFYLSRDGGNTFIRRGGNLPVGSYDSILINPQNPNEIYTASSMDVRNGLYYSNDAGETWKQLDQKDINLASRRIRALAFDPQNPNRLFIGTHSSGILRIEKDSANANSDTIGRPRVAQSTN